MKIIEYPFTPIFYIILFEARNNIKYSINRDGTYVLENVNSICMDFSNNRNLKLKAKEIIGSRFSNITEQQAIDIMDRASIKPPYLNYSSVMPYFDLELTAFESLKSYLTAQAWDIPLDRTCIIVPKKSKTLTGKKFEMEFYVDNENAPREILDVYMSAITKTSKSVSFSVKIPEQLYNICMTHPEVEERPLKNYIEGNTISYLHDEMSQWVSKKSFIDTVKKDAETAKKVIIINFSSSEKATRNDYNHAYTGQVINTRFNFYVAYQTKKGDLFNYKKLQSGLGSTEKGISGIIDTEKFNDKQYIRFEKCNLIVDWSAEKEEYLLSLEGQFRKLNENLNFFLKDLTEEKLNELITNNAFKLLN